MPRPPKQGQSFKKDSADYIYVLKQIRSNPNLKFKEFKSDQKYWIHPNSRYTESNLRNGFSRCKRDLNDYKLGKGMLLLILLKVCLILQYH